jgi:hypothetical protein
MKSTTAGILVVVALAAAAAWYLNARQPVEGHPSTTETGTIEIAPEPSRPVVEYPIESVRPETEVTVEPLPEVVPEPLPDLAASDSVMVELLNDLLGSEALLEFFVTEQFINRIVATVDTLPSRKVAPLVLPVRPPAGKFLVVGEESPFIPSPANDARYAPYVDIIERVDIPALVQAYVRYYPLFQQAYQDLGYPDGYFNDRLVEVIDHLLQTPEVPLAPDLEAYEAVYVYRDEGLEGLSAGQKTLLRIGIDNRQRVFEALRQLRNELTRGWADREVVR